MSTQNVIGSETFNYKIIRQFTIATVIWGVLGMSMGVYIASQLVFPELSFNEYLGYGRLRPVHTNLVIFGFGGSA